MSKISGIYKITNTITGDFYIGSSKNIKHRWAAHKCTSRWNNYTNNKMYIDMKKYDVYKFEMQILAEVETGSLKEIEQQFIETLKPAYNQMNAKGLDIERRKEYQKEYKKTDKYKKSQRKAVKEYNNQLCIYNNEKLTLNALAKRFRKAGIIHPTQEAKKFLIKR